LGDWWIKRLFSQSEFFDNISVASLVFSLEIIKELATTCHHLDDATTRVIVLCVSLEVRLEIFDAIREDSDLNFWRTRISLVSGVLLHERLFFFPFHRSIL